jgi:hypothetical protein
MRNHSGKQAAPTVQLTRNEYLQHGIQYVKDFKLAEAIVYLEKAKSMPPANEQDNDRVIDAFISRIYDIVENNVIPQNLQQNIGVGGRGLVDFVDTLSSQICKKSYRDSYEKLQHDHLAMLAFCKSEKNEKVLLLKQLDWIHQLLIFLEKNYLEHQGHHTFIEPDLTAKNAVGSRLRLKSLGNAYAMHIINKKFSGNHAVVFEALMHSPLQELTQTIANSDAKNVLGKIFETIHQFPRNRRGEWVELLPWGPNSWYLMDFCASFFKDDNQISNASHMFFVIEGALGDEYKQLKEYQASTHFAYQFADAAISDILRDDVPAMRQFFTGLRANIASDGASELPMMRNLVNIEPLLWYYKHTFQYIKLNTLLPYRNDLPLQIFQNSLLQEPNGKEMVLTPLVKLNLLTLQYSRPMLAASLKSRLSLIRRIQLISEMFCTRNWGSQLKDINYFDYRTLSIIRDGLCHIEDLTSAAVIHELERTKIVANIYDEWSELRKLINKAIITRQQHFTNYANDVKKMPEFLDQTWVDIKKYYQPRIAVVKNHQPFTPHVLLLTQNQLDDALLYLKPNTDESRDMMRMLRGELPFVMPSNCLSITAGKDKELKSNRKKLNSLLKIAKNEYNELTRDHIKAESAKRAALENEMEARMNASMRLSFPEICRTADKIKLAWSGAKSVTLDEKKGEAVYALDCLQSRVGLLCELMDESGVNFSSAVSINSKQLQVLLVEDVEVMFSCHYLISQIISILNKLSSFNLLAKLRPDLELKLNAYVALRNALEHTDAVIDSKDDLFFHMRNNLHGAIADFVIALLEQHQATILKLNTTNFVNAHQHEMLSESDRHKQSLALNLDDATSPVQHRKSFGLFDAPNVSPDQAVVVNSVLLTKREKN